jgi:hypothetical protein
MENTPFNIGNMLPGTTLPHFSGPIAEVLVLPSSLSTADRQLLEGYLAWKWSGLIDRPWTPAQLPGLALWLDADDASTITLNGSTVAQWNDKSGNARHASQATAANQPTRTLNGLGGRTVVTFDGTDDWLGLSASVFSNQLSWSYAAVALKNSATEPVCLFTERVASNQASIGVLAASSTILNRAGGTDAATVIEQTEAAAFPVNAAQILGSVQAPTSGSAYRNGNLTASNSATKASLAFRALAIGGNQLSNTSPAAGQQWWPGPVGEVVITDTTLSTTNRQLLEGYLAWKWSNLL